MKKSGGGSGGGKKSRRARRNVSIDHIAKTSSMREKDADEEREGVVMWEKEQTPVSINPVRPFFFLFFVVFSPNHFHRPRCRY